MNNTLLQITSSEMGSGDTELGKKLLSNYLKLIYDEDRLPRFIALYNGGVKIVADNSLTDTLQNMEKKGVKIIACKTCLNQFNLIDKMEAGITGTMMDIIELQTMADKVVNL